MREREREKEIRKEIEKRGREDSGVAGGGGETALFHVRILVAT